jgi:glycosyltransferase involved in cell wall biosynthesis
MRIALDATPLTVTTGGIARYTAELSRALAANFPDDEFWLVSDQPFRLPDRAPANLRQGAAPVRLWQRRWWSAGLIAELARRRIEVFHGTDFAVPYLPVRPAVLTLHDLSPWRDRGWHPHGGRVRRRTPILLRLGLATMVVTPTEAIRREAIARFRIPPERIAAVPLAAAPIFRPVPAEPAPPPYFLYAGVIERRKNLGVILEAWRELRHSHPVRLLLAGRRRADGPEIRPEPGLEVLGEVPDDRLAALYSNALALLYPSLYEGFGLPVLEAMACGAPVIASRDPALAEVAGEAALKLDAGDPRPWFAAMKLAFENPLWRARQRERSLERARNFSWSLTARRTREVYVEARRRFEA